MTSPRKGAPGRRVPRPGTCQRNERGRAAKGRVALVSLEDPDPDLSSREGNCMTNSRARIKKVTVYVPLRKKCRKGGDEVTFGPSLHIFLWPRPRNVSARSRITGGGVGRGVRLRPDRQRRKSPGGNRIDTDPFRHYCARPGRYFPPANCLSSPASYPPSFSDGLWRVVDQFEPESLRLFIPCAGGRRVTFRLRSA